MSIKHGKSLVKMSGNPVHKSKINALVLKIMAQSIHTNLSFVGVKHLSCHALLLSQWMVNILYVAMTAAY